MTIETNLFNKIRRISLINIKILNGNSDELIKMRVNRIVRYLKLEAKKNYQEGELDNPYKNFDPNNALEKGIYGCYQEEIENLIKKPNSRNHKHSPTS